MTSARKSFVVQMLTCIPLLFLSIHAGAEEIKIGVIKSLSTTPVFLAIDRGYFAAEGLEPKLITFESAQPVAVAATSRDIDVGTTAFTGGLFGLAGQGAIRVIAGYASSVPGFHLDAFVVSNRAWDGGFRTYKDFPGHSFGISQLGTPPHYELALVAEKYGFDLNSVTLVRTQSNANVAAALVGGQIDSTSLLGALAIPLIDQGKIKFLGWTSDVVSWELGAAFVGAKTAADRPDLIEKFLRGYRKGVRDYHDAFTTSDGSRVNGPDADAVAAIAAKYTGLSQDEAKQGAVYFDRDARIDETAVMHEIDWLLKEGLIKQPVDPKILFDDRFVVPLPKH